MTINWFTTIKNYGGKSGGCQCFRRRSCQSNNYWLLFICYYPNLYKKDILRFRMFVYRFHVFQTSGNSSLAIFTLLEPYDASSPPYIEFNGIYTGGKRNTFWRFVCLCWGLTSQSTIFQSCRDGATASWVINQYVWGVKCLAQGHNTAAVGFEPPTFRSGVRHSTTEPPRSPTFWRKESHW